MKQRNGSTDDRIAQSGQPTSLLRRRRFNVSAHNLDEHQFAQAQTDAFCARPLSACLEQCQLDESVQQAARRLARATDAHQRRQAAKQWVEWPRLATEKT